MGFDNYSEPLKIYLKKYRDALKSASTESPAKKQKTGSGPEIDDSDRAVAAAAALVDGASGTATGGIA